jgi:Flp pilus assembly protein TadD
MAEGTNPAVGILKSISRRAVRLRQLFRQLSSHLTSIRVRSVWKTLQVIVALLPSVGVVAGLYQVTLEALDRSVAIQPLSVPKSLADAGYSQDVAAQKLNDAASKIMERALTRVKRERIAVANSPAVSTSQVGSSFAALVSAGLHFFHLSFRTYISGEITEMNGGYSLTLRMSDRQGALKPIGPTRNLDDLFGAGSREIIWNTQPYIVASADYHENSKLALWDVNRIIEDRSADDPDVASAYNLRGILHEDATEYTLAEADFRRALSMAPLSSVPHFNLGTLYMLRRLFPKATVEYTMAITLEPELEEAQNLLGVLLMKARDSEGAIRQFHLAMKLNEFDPQPHYNLGYLLYRQGKLPEAIEEYHKAVRLGPRLSFIHDQLGLAFEKQGNVASAKREYVLAIALQPASLSPHAELGKIYLRTRQPDRAVSEYRRIVALASGISMAHFDLAVALAQEMLVGQSSQPQASLAKEVCSEFRKAFNIDHRKLYATNMHLWCAFPLKVKGAPTPIAVVWDD